MKCARVWFECFDRRSGQSIELQQVICIHRSECGAKVLVRLFGITVLGSFERGEKIL